MSHTDTSRGRIKAVEIIALYHNKHICFAHRAGSYVSAVYIGIEVLQTSIWR